MKNRILKITSGIITLIAMALIFLFAIDLWSLIAPDSAYRFGSELHSWRYASQSRYMAVGIFEIGFSLVVAILGFLYLRRKTPVLMTLQVTLFLSLVASLLFL